MGYRLDNPAQGSPVAYEFDLPELAAGTASVSGGGTVTAAGNKDTTATATVTAKDKGVGTLPRKGAQQTASVPGGGQIIASGALAGLRFDSPASGPNYIFDGPNAFAQFGVAIISGGGEVICNGVAGEGNTVSITGGGGLSVAIEKNAQVDWFVEYWVNLQVTTEKNANAAVSISGGGNVLTVGLPTNQAFVNGGGIVTVVPSKGAEVTASITGGGAAVASGTKQEDVGGAAVVSGGGQVTAIGTSGNAALGTVIINGGGGVATTTQKLAAAVATVSVGLGMQLNTTGDHNVSATISGGGTVSVTEDIPAKVIGEVELEGLFADVELIALVRA